MTSSRYYYVTRGSAEDDAYTSALLTIAILRARNWVVQQSSCVSIISLLEHHMNLMTKPFLIILNICQAVYHSLLTPMAS